MVAARGRDAALREEASEGQGDSFSAGDACGLVGGFLTHL